MLPSETIRLTTLSARAGCASKLGQEMLGQLLHQLASKVDPNLVVGSASGDDAAVYRIDSERGLVQTVDFFTPIVDAPFDFGRVAATNALSDVYAMGGRPLTAMNLLGVPLDKVPPAAIVEILRGGVSKVEEAGASVVGGHSIQNAEPIYGLSVTGLVSLNRIMTNAAARPGDVLVLTKPLGTGIATTGIKRGLASEALQKTVIRSMTTLNSVGAEVAERGLVAAATDVTGFGLLGHLGAICRASGVGAEIESAKIPVLDPEILALAEQDCYPGGSGLNLATAGGFVEWNDVPQVRRMILADAQTSGGLLFCVAPQNLGAIHAILEAANTLCSAEIGRIVSSLQPKISIS